MRNLPRYFILGIFVFLLIFLQFGTFVRMSHAQEELNPKLKQLFELTGIQDAVDNYGDNFLTGIRSQIQEGGFGEIENLVYDAFAPSKINAILNAEFQSNWNEDYANSIIAKFQQPLFRKFLEKEDYLDTEQGAAEFYEYQQNFLVNNYASQNRIDMIKKYFAVTGAIDTAAEVTANMTRALFVASNTMADIDMRVKEKEIDDKIAEFKEKAKPQMMQALLMKYLFAYSDFSDEDLQNYIAFHESTEAQWLIEHFNSAFLKAVKKCGEEFTAEFIKLVETAQKRDNSK